MQGFIRNKIVDGRDRLPYSSNLRNLRNLRFISYPRLLGQKNEISDLFSGDLVAADHQPSEQLANATPNSRVDLDVERRTNEQHQKTCFQLFHRKHLSKSILNASTRLIIVTSFRRGCYKSKMFQMRRRASALFIFGMALIPIPG